MCLSQSVYLKNIQSTEKPSCTLSAGEVRPLCHYPQL